jgi:hypothetical protein
VSDTAILTVLKALHGLAVKKRTLAHGKLVKSDPTLSEKLWRLAKVLLTADADHIVQFLRRMARRQDLATAHGVPAPGVSPNQYVRRWSAEVHGPDRTLIEQDLLAIPFDVDSAPAPPGSALDQGQHLYAAAEYARETFLPPAFRNVDLAVGAASSSGFKPGLISVHLYAVLERPVPMPVFYRYLTGAKASGLPLDPRPALPGQLFLTGRPLLWGCDDPVPEHLHAFVLPGDRQRVTEIDWNEFNAPLAAGMEGERRAHVAGAELGWRAVLERHLGDGGGRLGFFKPLSIALGYAARSAESADEIAGVMHAIVNAHPDLTADRAGQYTEQWLRRELVRLRAKDAARAAGIDASIGAIRAKFPKMEFMR